MHFEDEPQIGEIEPDLQMIIERWSDLPESFWAGIVAIVNATLEESLFNFSYSIWRSYWIFPFVKFSLPFLDIFGLQKRPNTVSSKLRYLALKKGVLFRVWLWKLRQSKSSNPIFATSVDRTDTIEMQLVATQVETGFAT